MKGVGDYTIPAINKYAADGDPKTFGEIYAYGFRNTHRFSWDLSDKTLYASDIGMSNVEEINIVREGANYGWMRREGVFDNGTNINGKLDADLLFSLPAYLGLDSLSGPLFQKLFGYLTLLLAVPVLVYSAADYWRSALVVATAIPLTISMTLVGMYFLNIPLHQISIAALIIALGMLVDVPVVASDGINRALHQGEPRLRAAWLGPYHLRHPMIFGTLINIVAFLPLLSQFWRGFTIRSSVGSGAVCSPETLSPQAGQNFTPDSRGALQRKQAAVTGIQG